MALVEFDGLHFEQFRSSWVWDG